MSGILGIWNWNGCPVEPDLLATLSGLLAHRGPDGEGRWLAGEIGLAFQNLWTAPESVGEIQPFVQGGQNVVLFDGRLDNREELLAQLERNGTHRVPPGSSDSVLVSAAYQTFGPAFVEKLNGDFALAAYDISQRKLFLARDAVGVRPLYFARVGETLLVASEVKPILGHPAIRSRPNRDMLAAALLSCFGQEKQGWTFFDGVSSVLPGQLITVAPRVISKRTYWDFGDPEPIRFSKVSEYPEAFGTHFERAVRRRLRSAYPVAVAVSGGVDSSSVYCTAEKLHRRGAAQCPDVLAVSKEVQGQLSDERTFLLEIERKYGRRVQRVPTTVQYVAGSLGQAFQDSEVPFFRAPLNSAYPFPKTIRSTGARVQLTGQWGDQMLADNAYLIDFIGQGHWMTVWRHLAEYIKWNEGVNLEQVRRGLLKDFVRYHTPEPIWKFLRNSRRRLTSNRSWYTEDFWSRARQAEEMQRFCFSGITAQQRSLYALVRPMYYQQALEWFNKIAAVNGLEIAYPFFDRDLISFLLAIPGGITCADGVPKAILRTALRDTLPEAISQRRWKAQITRELVDSMHCEFQSFSRYLERDVLCVDWGFVDESRMRKALPSLRAGILDRNGDEIVWHLGDLFGLEFWLQSFWGTKLNAEENTRHGKNDLESAGQLIGKATTCRA